MIPIQKREQCRTFIKNEEWKSAFKLAKGFDKLFTKDEIQKISISYECLVGNEQFYIMLKYDIEEIINEAKYILITYVEKFDSKK